MTCDVKFAHMLLAAYMYTNVCIFKLSQQLRNTILYGEPVQPSLIACINDFNYQVAQLESIGELKTMLDTEELPLIERYEREYMNQYSEYQELLNQFQANHQHITVVSFP